MRRAALVSVLSKKLRDSEVKFFESLAVAAPKTKMVSEMLRGLLNIKKSTKREFRTEKYKDVVSLNAGDTLDVSAFKEGDKVHIRGTMKGRGFQGTVHRYNFGGGPKTHGQKNRHRAPGSIGSTAPQRVWPGRRMAGHMGTTIVTVKNLQVVGVDPEKRTLMVKGAVPGTVGSIVEIRAVQVLKKKKEK